MQGDGDLEKTKAVIAELERFQKEKKIEPVSELPEFKKLQSISSKQLSDLELDKANRIITLSTQYETALEQLQKELTRTGKIDEATAIQDERNNVKNSDYLKAANRVMASATVKEDAQEVSMNSKKAAVPAALSKTMELSLSKDVKMKLALVPAGKFLMGSPAAEEGRAVNEMPQHEVTISRPFYMGIYEVRQEEYEAIVGNNPSTIRGRNFPVEHVTWDDAAVFCKQASAKTGKNVRLPTEAEWEYACRAGTKTRFSFGDDESAVNKYANYRDKSFTPDGLHPKSDGKSDGRDKTALVGSYKPNAWGLYDMHGNVAEWCQDWYWETYYEKSPAVDPKVPGVTGVKFQRGGSSMDEPARIRSAKRTLHPPIQPLFFKQYPYIFGFRVVVDTE